MDNFLSSIKQEINERLTTKYIITSRLDNNDCLHEDYVDSLHNIFDSQDFLAVYFLNGLSLKIKDERKYGNRIHAYNPFLSLIESAENGFDTIWSKNHGD